MKKQTSKTPVNSFSGFDDGSDFLHLPGLHPRDLGGPARHHARRCLLPAVAFGLHVAGGNHVVRDAGLLWCRGEERLRDCAALTAPHAGLAANEGREHAHTALALLQHMQPHALRQLAERIDAAHRVEGLVETGAEHGHAAHAGDDAKDAARDTRFGGDADVHHPVARAVVHAAGHHHAHHLLVDLGRHHLLLGDGVGAAVGTGCGHHGQVHGVHKRGALLEVRLQTVLLVKVAGADTIPLQDLRNLAVPCRCGGLGLVDAVVTLQFAAAIGAEELPEGVVTLVGVALQLHGDRDGAGVDVRVEGEPIGVHLDRVKRAASGLHAHLCLHELHTVLVQGMRVGEGLYHGLDGEGALKVAQLVNFALGCDNCDRKEVWRDQAQLRNVGRHGPFLDGPHVLHHIAHLREHIEALQRVGLHLIAAGDGVVRQPKHTQRRGAADAAGDDDDGPVKDLEVGGMAAVDGFGDVEHGRNMGLIASGVRQRDGAVVGQRALRRLPALKKPLHKPSSGQAGAVVGLVLARVAVAHLLVVGVAVMEYHVDRLQEGVASWDRLVDNQRLCRGIKCVRVGDARQARLTGGLHGGGCAGPLERQRGEGAGCGGHGGGVQECARDSAGDNGGLIV
mmetsp:Transcript_33050/g.83361  ORF Transcript_33050/g.83361 Transcript_33050/m.83361 type:complete len:620 (-) Transcript_33050:2445-4304(-)